MAQVYKRIKGRKIEKVMALQEDVQDALDRESFRMAVKAEHLLLAHRHEGHARIELDEGRIDRYVVLSDERGLKAAMSIEYGRRPDDEGNGGMEGLRILHRATGLGGDE
jgi:hypothetical protein